MDSSSAVSFLSAVLTNTVCKSGRKRSRGKALSSSSEPGCNEMPKSRRLSPKVRFASSAKTAPAHRVTAQALLCSSATAARCLLKADMYEYGFLKLQIFRVHMARDVTIHSLLL